MNEFIRHFGHININLEQVITLLAGLLFLISLIISYHNLITPRITALRKRRINDREVLDNYNQNHLMIMEKLNNLETLMIQTECDNKKYRVVSLQNKLYQLHSQFMQSGTVTRSQLTTFIATYEEYRGEGGNSIVHDKLYPEVIGLEIKEDQEDLI